MDEQIKPVAWMRRWAYEGIDVMAIPKKDRPDGWMFHAVTRHKAMRNDVALCPQQSIDALRAEVERLKLRDAQMRDAAMMLMAERDADRARIAHLAAEPVIEGFVALDKDFYEHAMDAAEDAGREEPNDDDLLDGMRRLLDAAIDAARKGGAK